MQKSGRVQLLSIQLKKMYTSVFLPFHWLPRALFPLYPPIMIFDIGSLRSTMNCNQPCQYWYSLTDIRLLRIKSPQVVHRAALDSNISIPAHPKAWTIGQCKNGWVRIRLLQRMMLHSSWMPLLIADLLQNGNSREASRIKNFILFVSKLDWKVSHSPSDSFPYQSWWNEKRLPNLSWSHW